MLTLEEIKKKIDKNKTSPVNVSEEPYKLTVLFAPTSAEYWYIEAYSSSS